MRLQMYELRKVSHTLKHSPPAIRMTALSAGSSTSAEADLERLTFWYLDKFQGSVSPGVRSLACSSRDSILGLSRFPEAITWGRKSEVVSGQTNFKQLWHTHLCKHYLFRHMFSKMLTSYKHNKSNRVYSDILYIWPSINVDHQIWNDICRRPPCSLSITHNHFPILRVLTAQTVMFPAGHVSWLCATKPGTLKVRKVTEGTNSPRHKWLTTACSTLFTL